MLLAQAGIQPVSKTPYLEIGTLLGQDEAACEASGESDTTACAPVKDPATGRYLVHQKSLDASGVVDDGEVLEVSVAKLPLVLGTATVTLRY